ncbi:hypothetical protein GCM10010193_67520 [Kitasatospora atroaurantiaca]
MRLDGGVRADPDVEELFGEDAESESDLEHVGPPGARDQVTDVPAHQVRLRSEHDVLISEPQAVVVDNGGQ